MKRGQENKVKFKGNLFVEDSSLITRGVVVVVVCRRRVHGPGVTVRAILLVVAVPPLAAVVVPTRPANSDLRIRLVTGSGSESTEQF